MTKGVKSIFMALIGTIALIVCSSFIVELVNVSLNGIQIQQMTKLTCNKALTLFSQESYKSRGTGGTRTIDDVISENGAEYVTGDFYDGSSSSDASVVYQQLYGSGDPYKKFAQWMGANDGEVFSVPSGGNYTTVSVDGVKGSWSNLELINRYLNNISSFPVQEMPLFENYYTDGGDVEAAFAAYDADMEKYTEFTIAKSFVDTYVTPLNFGVPYIDIETAEKMFRWNLTHMLSNGASDTNENGGADLIIQDEYGQNAIAYKGFMVYADQAEITRIDYKVFDVANPSSQSAKDFRDITHIDPSALGFEDNSAVNLDLLGMDTDERTKICVIGVEYTVPISYYGITPIRNIFNYTWNKEVEGWKDIEYEDREYRVYNTDKATLIGGGFTGNVNQGALPVLGKLIFYLVR